MKGLVVASQPANLAGEDETVVFIVRDMIDLIRIFALWPFYRLRDAISHRRFDQLVKSVTHRNLGVNDRGIELLPGGDEVPWAAIDGASWTSRVLTRDFANHGEDAVVTLRLKDGTARAIGPVDLEGPGWEAIKGLLERGLLPKLPEAGGRTTTWLTFVVDAVWLVGVVLLALALKLALWR